MKHRARPAVDPAPLAETRPIQIRVRCPECGWLSLQPHDRERTYSSHYFTCSRYVTLDKRRHRRAV